MDRDQQTLIFNERFNAMMAKIARLRHIPLDMSLGRIEGVVQIMQRLLLLVYHEVDLDLPVFEKIAHMNKIATGIEGRTTVKERTVQNWRRDAVNLNLMKVEIRAHEYGGRAWNHFTVHLFRVDELLSVANLTGNGRKRVETISAPGVETISAPLTLLLNPQRNLPPPSEQCAPPCATSGPAAADEVGVSKQIREPTAFAKKPWVLVRVDKGSTPVLRYDHFAASDREALTQELQKCGVERTGDALEFAARATLTTAQVLTICDELRANSAKFTKPGGALVARLRDGYWPIGGIVSPEVIARREADLKRRNDTADHQRRIDEFVRECRKKKMTDDEITTAMRARGLIAKGWTE